MTLEGHQQDIEPTRRPQHADTHPLIEGAGADELDDAQLATLFI